MTYSVKEIFLTLQGEGRQTGKTAVFCRFAGCNLWSGREEDRALARCNFCDTDFNGIDGPGGGRFHDAEALAKAIRVCWGERSKGQPWVVLTGGEPLLQVDKDLIDALHQEGFLIALETNGTLAAPQGIDWICVSPKGQEKLVQTSGQELKLVFPQPQIDPAQFLSLAFDYFLLQPMDGPQQAENMKLAIHYCMANPQWQLSLQTHKLMGIP
ncbi:MAG: 7-carboxy-7-deazaguanine synthase [Betaproteobacteria bacterium]|nr:7-carboxy-7-deazaguanine synthase [Betaproteobacteria bacterium]